MGQGETRLLRVRVEKREAARWSLLVPRGAVDEVVLGERVWLGERVEKLARVKELAMGVMGERIQKLLWVAKRERQGAQARVRAAKVLVVPQTRAAWLVCLVKVARLVPWKRPVVGFLVTAALMLEQLGSLELRGRPGEVVKVERWSPVGVMCAPRPVL